MATTKKKTTSQVDMSDVIATPFTAPEEKMTFTGTTKKKEVIPDSALINVKSNVFGKLIFVSKRTGERIVWEQCGDVQQVTMNTLRLIKTEAVAFFRDQWILVVGFADENSGKFNPPDVYEQLFVTQYYKEVIDPSDYEAICSMKPNEIAEKIPQMSDGAKANLVIALNTYIEKGVLDSIRAIKAFEEALGCDLRDPD